jgi:hypothetical protein
MSVISFTAEVTTCVTVDVLAYTPPIRGRYSNLPELCEPAEPADLELRVTLGAVDVTEALPPDVLDALRAEALDQLAS